MGNGVFWASPLCWLFFFNRVSVVVFPTFPFSLHFYIYTLVANVQLYCTNSMFWACWPPLTHWCQFSGNSCKIFCRAGWRWWPTGVMYKYCYHVPYCASRAYFVFQGWFLWQFGFSYLLLQSRQDCLFQRVAQETIMPDACKPLWQDVHGKPAYKLPVGEADRANFTTMPVILSRKSNLPIVDVLDPVVADCNFVCIPSKIFYHLFLVQIQWVTIKMQGHRGQATCIIGKCAVTFSRNFNMSFQFLVHFPKFRYIFTCPFD